MAPSPEPSYSTGLVWFRRDLRANDHAALYRALTQCRQVHCVFVFDSEILDALPRADRRVEFIRDSLVELDAALRALGQHPHAGLIVRHAMASDAVPALAQALQAQAVYANHDDEPRARQRDSLVRTRLAVAGIAFHTFKDHTLLERNEVLTQTGTPYSVFTPYKNAWLRTIDAFQLQSYAVERHAHRLAPRPAGECLDIPSLSALGFEATPPGPPRLPAGSTGAMRLFDDFLHRIERYHDTRDFPAVKGPSYLSVHLRFGTVSPRLLARSAHALAQAGNPGAATWLNELIWRDFYAQILFHHPHVVERSFKPAYDAIQWETGAAAQALFSAWCEGRTGYPLVDAAMAQLNDFDLASNNGGWQWASSSGCDAQPYFRIFNPVSQSEKFDKEGRFIRRYLPQLAKLPTAALHAPWRARPLELQEAGVVLGQTYPHPVVDHDSARQRTLQRYAVVKAG